MRFMWGFKYFDADLVEETNETFTLQMQSPAANLFTKQVNMAMFLMQIMSLRFCLMYQKNFQMKL